MYIKYLVIGAVEVLKRRFLDLEKDHFLSSFLGSCRDRPSPYIHGWLESAAALGDLGDQVGVQLLAMVEGHTVQYPLSGYHRCFTHLPDHWGQRTEAEISISSHFPDQTLNLLGATGWMTL